MFECRYFLVQKKNCPSNAIRLRRHHNSVAPRICPHVLVVVASHAAKTPLLSEVSESRMSLSLSLNSDRRY